MKKVLSVLLVVVMLLTAVPVTDVSDILGVTASAANLGKSMSDWIFQGDAQYNSTSGEYTLIPDRFKRSGGIWLKSNIKANFKLSLDYYTGNHNGADGISVIFYNEKNYSSGVGGSIMQEGVNGYIVELDTYYNSEYSDPTTQNHISINKSPKEHLVWDLLPESEDDNWHNLVIEVINETCSVYVDGQLKVSYKTSYTSYGNLGIVASSADFYNKHAVKNITIIDDYEAGNTTFTPNWLSQDSATYNHDLARFCAESSLKCYPGKGMDEFLSNNGFVKSDCSEPGNTNRDELAYYIASRKDTIGEKEYNTVLVSFVGTTPCEQWSSNFDPYFRYKNGDLLPSTNHAGFQMAMGCVYSGLEKFLEKMKKNNDLTKENTKFILTGHSRGAAASNLMAAMMIDEEKYATKENIFTYTFATPNNTKDTSVSADKYLRIFNIVNPCDFVTHVMPTAWEYGKYGTVISLPEPYVTDYNQKVIVEYKKLTGRDYFAYYENGQKEVVDFVNKLTQKVSNVSDFYGKKFKIGDFTKETVFNFFQDTLCKIAAESNDKTSARLKLVSVLKEPFCDSVFTSISSFFLKNGVAFEPLDFDKRFNDNHSMELYCAFVKGLTSDEIQHKRTYTIGKYNCPVDVEVIEVESGEVVGRIVNNVVDEEIAEKENAVVMTVEGDEKECWLPSDGNYKIILTGNDTGTMDHVLSIYDPVEGEIARTCFNQVELEKGLVMKSDVNGEDFKIEEYTLNYEDGSTRVADVVMQDEEIETKEINVITEGEGYVGDNYKVKKGDYITLEAITLGSKCNKFAGYYADDELLSAEANYRFRVDESMTITAKFEVIHDFDKGETTTLPTCTEKGITTYTCTTCGDTKTETIKAEGHKEAVYSEMLPATCTADGHTAETRCTVCGVVITKSSVIPATGHTDTDNNGKCDTCGEDLVTNDPSENCNHLCHKKGFWGWIWVIINVINIMLGKNPVCSCGVAHY